MNWTDALLTGMFNINDPVFLLLSWFIIILAGSAFWMMFMALLAGVGSVLETIFNKIFDVYESVSCFVEAKITSKIRSNRYLVLTTAVVSAIAHYFVWIMVGSTLLLVATLYIVSIVF